MKGSWKEMIQPNVSQTGCLTFVVLSFISVLKRLRWAVDSWQLYGVHYSQRYPLMNGWEKPKGFVALVGCETRADLESRT